MTASHSANAFRIFYGLTVRALAQADWLERFAPLDTVRKRAPHLFYGSSPVLCISEPFGCELRRSQIEIGARELRVLTHGITWPDRVIAHNLGRSGTLLKKFLFLNHPAVAKYFCILGPELPAGVALLALHGHRITTCSLKDYLVANLWLGEGVRDGALDILSPDPRAVRPMSAIARRDLRSVVTIGISAMIKEFSGNALPDRPWEEAW